jgi:hypothetical protein
MEGMNAYGLVAVIIQSIFSLAWPVALVIVVFLFRRELRKILPALRVKYGDLEVSMRLDKAEEAAAALPEPPEEVAEARPTPEEVDRFEQIADLSPRAAILEERANLKEAVIARAAAVAGVTLSNRMSFLNAVVAAKQGSH